MSKFIRPAQLAERWGVTIGHLANLRAAGEGPEYTKPMGRVLYVLADVERIEAESLVRAAV